MFGLGMFIGIVLGANISLIIYAMIVAGARSDEYDK